MIGRNRDANSKMTVNDMFGIAGKHAIVWGGGAGMGLSTAERLAAAGCRIALVDIDAARAEQAADALKAAGAEVVALQADVTSAASVDAAVAAAEQALGPLDLMATVIGIGVWSSLLDMTEEQWQDAFRLNLTSFFLPARAVARSLIAGGRPGAIVGVASVSGITSAPRHGGYGAAKAGMVNLVRSMATEWGRHGVRVNAIAPGAIETPRIQMPADAREKMARKFPLGRPGTTDEIGKAALFLLSDLASYVTGHTLPVEGGWLSTFLMHDAGGGGPEA